MLETDLLKRRSALRASMSADVQASAAVASVVLKNKHGMEVHLISTGAIVQRLLVPDKHGNILDVVLGFDDPKLYGVSAFPLAIY